MKKGFTLIELLAVIVILAIIALIATPIVLSIISDSKDSASLRSAEMYLSAVEYGISDTIMDNKTIPNETYIIMGNGNICIGTYSNKTCEGNILEVEVNGEVPSEESTITIEEGKIKGVKLLYGDNTIIKDSKGNLVYEKEYNEGNETTTITLTASDFKVGEVNSEGFGLTENPNNIRIYMLNLLELPTNGNVSVECESPYQWIVYFYSSKSPSDYVGKTSFTSDSINDILSSTIVAGTIEGATHFRISLRNSTNTSADLSGRIDEFMENVRVTITSTK